MRARSVVWLVALGVAVTLVGTACSENRSTTTTSTSTVLPVCDAETVLDCPIGPTSLDQYLPKRPVRASGTPIKIAVINTDSGPAGAFPELSQADETAVRFINAELGGVDGHPIVLSRCDTQFSPEKSNACSQAAVQDGVAAVAGGIDVLGTGLTVLEENQIPYVGGIPVSTLSATSSVSFQFSGGTWGAMVAYMQYAAKELHAKRVSVIYGDFGAITDAAKLGERVGQGLGLDVRLVSMPILASDYVTPFTAANEDNPDAIIALVADSGCVPAYQAVHDLAITAKIFYTGACLSPKIIEAAGPEQVEGSFFNVEGPVSSSSGVDRTGQGDTALYGYIVEKYGQGLEAQSAATVSFRGFMNLWVAMKEVGGDRVSASTLIKHLRTARNHPSFMGYPYTCDGEQLPEQPAMCAPQQILVRYRKGKIAAVTGWIDVPAIVSST